MLKLNIGAGRFKKDGWTNIDHRSDHYQKNQIDYDIDLMSDFVFPFKNNSVDIIYTSHLFEHLYEENVQHLCTECFRILKKGGVFRITCPDARAGYDAVMMHNEEFFDIYASNVVFNSEAAYFRYNLKKYLKFASIYQKFLYFLCPERSEFTKFNTKKFSDKDVIYVLTNYSYETALNKICENVAEEVRKNNAWMHITWWDVKKIKKVLQKNNYEKVYQSHAGLSEEKELRDLYYFDWALPKISLYVEAKK